MSSTSSVASSGQISAVPSFSDDLGAVPVTVEALMAWVEQRLGAMDKNIQAFMKKTKENDARQAKLNDISAAISSGDAAAAGAALDELKSSSDPADQAMAARLEKNLPDDLGSISPDMSAEDLKKFQGPIDDINGEMKSSSQMDMMNLQNMVKDRQQVVDIASNIMTTLQKSEDTPINNLRG